MKQSDRLLSKCVLLERALHAATEDFYNETKKELPAVANVIRKELYAINRTHKYFFDTVQPILKVEFLEDSEMFYQHIDNFFDV